jgi:hypothetical protein
MRSTVEIIAPPWSDIDGDVPNASLLAVGTWVNDGNALEK